MVREFRTEVGSKCFLSSCQFSDGGIAKYRWYQQTKILTGKE